MSRIERFWRAVGGRKQVNGYIYAALVTFGALQLDPFPFDSYALYLSLALLGTSALVGIEDARKRASPPAP